MGSVCDPVNCRRALGVVECLELWLSGEQTRGQPLIYFDIVVASILS
jgi:hypothetical protein